jgi:hypothetical protein
MKKITVLCCFLAFVLSQGRAQNRESQVPAPVESIRVLADSGLAFEQRKAEITARWNELRPSFTGGTPYDVTPSAKAPYEAGKLKDGFLADGLNTVNFIRFLAGLPDDVELRADYTEMSQHGSVLNAAKGAIAHSQSKPGNMPADFYRKASAGIGRSNRDRLGHRRWLLNPSMKYTGLGFSGGFSSMYVFDESRRDRVEYQAVCFPGGTAWPNDFFGGDWAWSVSLNPDLYQRPTLNNVRVTLTEQATGKKWVFSRSGKNGYFNINTTNYGIPNCIIFLPSGITEYLGLYSVEIAGLKDKNGKAAVLSYEITFFPIETEARATDFEFTVNESGETKTITITSYRGTQKHLKVPAEINGVTVSSIGSGAFTYSSVTAVGLPDTLTEIKDHAFWYSNIISMTVPPNVKYIGQQAFYSCPNLSSVSVPPGIVLGDFVFTDCKKLKEITIPADVDDVGYGVFRGCSGLDPAIREELRRRFGPWAFGE